MRNRRSHFFLSLCLFACLFAAACGGEKERAPEAQAKDTAGGKKGAPGGAPGPGVAPPMTTPAKVAGGWMRDVPAQGFEGREGFQLDEDGTLHLVNIYTMNGLAWQLNGDQLQFLCNTERYTEPQMSKLALLNVDENSLLAESGDYFTGNYERAQLARVTGSVAYRERIALTEDAVLRVTIRDLEERDRIVGQRLIYHPGQVPIEFSVVYNPGVIDEAHRYEIRAEIVDKERLAFVTSQTYPVITQGGPSKIEVLVRAADKSP